MKKTMNRLTAMLLVLAMMLTILPLGVFAAEDITVDVKNGTISVKDLANALNLGTAQGMEVYNANDLPGDGTKPAAESIYAGDGGRTGLTPLGDVKDLHNGAQYAAFKATRSGNIISGYKYAYDYANPVVFTAKFYHDASAKVTVMDNLEVEGGLLLNGEPMNGTVRLYAGETYVVDVVAPANEKQAVDLKVTINGTTTVVKTPYTLPALSGDCTIEAVYYKNAFATVNVNAADHGTVVVSNSRDGKVTEGNTFSVKVTPDTANGWLLRSVTVTKDGQPVEAVEGVYGPVVDGEVYTVSAVYYQAALNLQDGEVNYQTASAASGAGSLNEEAKALEQEIFDAIYVSSYPTMVTLDEARAADSNYLKYDANGDGNYQPVYAKKPLIDLNNRHNFATGIGQTEKVRLIYHAADAFGNKTVVTEYATVTLADMRPATQIVVGNPALSYTFDELPTEEQLMEDLNLSVLDVEGNLFELPEGASFTLEHEALKAGKNEITIWYNSPESDPDHSTSKTTVTIQVSKAAGYIEIEDQNAVYGDPIEIKVDTNAKDYVTAIMGVDVVDKSLNGYVSIHLPESAKSALYIKYSTTVGLGVKLALAAIDGIAKTELSKYAGNDYLDLYTFVADWFKDGINMDSMGSLLDILDMLLNNDVIGGLLPEGASGIFDALRQVFDYIRGMEDSIATVTDHLTICLEQTPTEIGVYGVFAVLTDSNYTIAADAGYLTIRTRTANNSGLTIEFTTPVEGTLTEKEAKSFVFGGTLSDNGKLLPNVQVTSLYTGTNAYGETVSSASPIRVPGTYTETLSVVSLNYYVVVSRTYTIASDRPVEPEDNGHELGTFTVAAYNVDGLPTGLLGNAIVINEDGPGAEGTKAISQKLAEAGWDLVGVSENFNYNKELMSALEGYTAGTFRGGIDVLNVLEGIVNKTFRLDSDGLNLLWKNSIQISEETWSPWNVFNGYLLNENDGLINKGYRRYVATLAEGVDVDVYILHMDAGSTAADIAARNAQWRQLVSAIKNSNTTNPVIIMGDTNSRYTRDMMESVVINSLNADPRFTAADAWVELVNDGAYPAFGTEALDEEVVDKVLFVNNNTSAVRLTAKSYALDASFVNEDGVALADHKPVVVEFGYAISEHVYTATETKPATCTEDGEMTFVCEQDGFTYTEVIPALGHDYQLSATKAPTCTEAGTETYACSRCQDSYNTTIPATGHTCTDTVVAATCETEGYTLHTCTVCAYSFRDNIVAATGHAYDAVITEPGCETEGYTTYTCHVCGDSYVDDYVAAFGHNWGQWHIETANSCVQDGVRTRVCDTCHESETQAIAAAGHQFVTTTVAATCDKDGCDVHTCSVCDYAYQDNIVAATGHDYEKTVTEPTCTAKGYTTYTCSICGDSYVADYTDVVAHTYEVTTDVAATCTNIGYKISTCSGCNNTTVEIIDALGHSYVDTTVAATCTTDGYDLHTCSVCDSSYRDNETPAIGHNLVNGEALEATCTEPGHKASVICSVCDVVFVEGEIVEALGHHYDCCVCSRCGDEQDAPVIIGQPTNFVGTVGEIARFTVTTDRTNVNYRWYYSQDGGKTWLASGLPGYQTATIEVAMKSFRIGQLYKCVITDCLGNELVSDVVSLNLPSVAVEIVSQPESVIGKIGTIAEFHVEAIGEGLTYQWEYSKDGGVTWSKSGMDGAKTNTLVVAITKARNGQMYRCLVTDQNGVVLTSAIAAMSVCAASAN